MRDAPSSSLLSQLPWLLDANTWALESQAGQHESPAETGTWPVGNGWIFAHAGLRKPYNRLRGITGPTYQTVADHAAEGAFGDMWLELRTERGTLPLPVQEIWRPRHSGVLVTRGHDQAVAVVTIDFAPPDHPLIVRIVEVWHGDLLGSSAQLTVRLPSGKVYDERQRSLRADGGPGRVLVASALAPGRLAYPGRIDISLETVARTSGVQRLTVLLAAGPDTANAFERLPQLLHPVTLLDQTRAHWRIWLDRTRTPDLWPQNLTGPTLTTRSIEDLLEMGKLSLKMQQALPGGAVSPMVHYKGTWTRDTNGPVRAFLAMGAHEEVQDMLEYNYRSAIVLGHIPNRAPLDLDVDGVKEPGDWSGIAVPRAEVPSLIILQHRWWLEAGGDPDLVRRHWDYLVRCATGQRASPDGLLSFHGDETYLHGALYAVFPERCGWPNDLVAEASDQGYTPWALDSTMEYVAALEAMGRMAQAIDRGAEAGRFIAEAQRVRKAVEQHFWMEEAGYYAPAIYPLSGAPHEAPFAPVNLQPLWLGYHASTDARALRNLNATVDLVGFTASTPNCDYTVGLTPGYLLWDLVAVKSDLAPLALANLVAMASPAGEWAEVYGPGGVPDGAYQQHSPNRLRPWEGGVNLEAIYQYFERRRPEDEPDQDLRGVERRGKTFGPGPVRAYRMRLPALPSRVLAVTADLADIATVRSVAKRAADATIAILEPGLPLSADCLGQMLFDPANGARRVDVLMLGASALAGDRRSMKPAEFWRLPQISDALARFQRDGGRLLRPG